MKRISYKSYKVAWLQGVAVRSFSSSCDSCNPCNRLPLLGPPARWLFASIRLALRAHQLRMNAGHVAHVTLDLEQVRRPDDVFPRHLFVAGHIEIKTEIQLSVEHAFIQFRRRCFACGRGFHDFL